MALPIARDHAPSLSRISRHSDTDSTDVEKYSDDESIIVDDEDLRWHDGHRPTNGELNRSISRTRQTATSTTLTQTLSRRPTTLSRLRSRPDIPRFTHPLAHKQTTVEELVDFDGPDDPYRPLNWPTKKKVTTTLLYGLVTMTATWASSSYSAGTTQISQHFHVGSEVATLGTTLFLFGFGIGPCKS